MEKRLLSAFIVTFIFLIAWSYLVPKSKPEAQTTLTEEVIKEAPGTEEVPLVAEEVSEGQPIAPQRDGENITEARIGNFFITYSSTNGYIKNIALDSPENVLPFHNIGFTPSRTPNEAFSTRVESDKIVFTKENGRKKEFIFSGKLITIKTTLGSKQPMLVLSNYLYDSMLDQRYQEIFYSRDQEIKRTPPKKVKEEEIENVEFAGARDRYYCAALVNNQYDVQLVKDEEVVHVYLEAPPEHVDLFIGPQTIKSLEPFGLQGVVNYGFFHAIGMLMIKVLYFFYFFTHSWGISIICFAIFIYLVLFPFTSKSTKAMRRMQEVQPEIEELKKKYSDNPQKMQKETIGLYRKYKINPLGGCLPLFFQLPIFIALYQVLFRFTELKGAEFLWIKDLASPDHFLKLPFPPPINYLNLLPILIVIVGLTQQRITTAGSSSSQQQKSIGLFFSVFLGVIFYNFPSALVLYWFVQNLLSLIYQAKITRSSTLKADEEQE